MKRLASLVLLSVMAVLVFAAIGLAQSSVDQGSSNQYSLGQPPSSVSSLQPDPVQNTLMINIHDHTFDPAQLNVPPKTTVTWTNNDMMPHTVTSDDGKLFDSGALQPGQSYSVWFDGSGTVTYHCKIHPDMKASLIVGDANSGEGTTSGNATNGAGQPSGGSTQPTSNPTQQASDSTQPAVQPTSSTTQLSSDSTQPSGSSPRPSGDHMQPANGSY